jgi:hypothetical membrane protein
MNSPRAVAKLALAAGVLVAPTFYLTVFIQAAMRDGYSLSRVALSLLSLGNEGWIQITNFIVCGLLALISVFGFRAACWPGIGAGSGARCWWRSTASGL